MSESKVEEIIAVLWFIASFLAFNNGWNIIGTILAVKASFDVICAIGFAFIEVRNERKTSTLK